MMRLSGIACGRTDIGKYARHTVTDMHTTVHAKRTKDHALIFGPKNKRVIILNGHDPNRAADCETLYMHAQWLKVIDAAENEESLEP